MSVQTFVPDTSITFTGAAIEHLRKRLQDNQQARGIRVSVKPSGCSGYKYVLDTVETAANDDVVLHVGEGLDVFVDRESLPMLKGMEVDYIKEGLNRFIQFRNPNVTGECGCGESFTVN